MICMLFTADHITGHVHCIVHCWTIIQNLLLLVCKSNCIGEWIKINSQKYMYVHVEWDLTDSVWTSKIYVYDKIHHMTFCTVIYLRFKSKLQPSKSDMFFRWKFTCIYIVLHLIKLKKTDTFILNLTKISQNIRFLIMLNCVKQKKKSSWKRSFVLTPAILNNVLGKAHW